MVLSKFARLLRGATTEINMIGWLLSSQTVLFREPSWMLRCRKDLRKSAAFFGGGGEQKAVFSTAPCPLAAGVPTRDPFEMDKQQLDLLAELHRNLILADFDCRSAEGRRSHLGFDEDGWPFAKSDQQLQQVA